MYNLKTIFFLTFAISSFTVWGHHSALANFDSSRTITKEGKIVEVKFVNPHTSVKLEIVNEEGEKEFWLAEFVSKNALIRRKFDMSKFAIGSSVSISGWPGKRGKTLYFREATFPDGTYIGTPDNFGQPLL